MRDLPPDYQISPGRVPKLGRSFTEGAGIEDISWISRTNPDINPTTMEDLEFDSTTAKVVLGVFAAGILAGAGAIMHKKLKRLRGEY